MTTTPVTISGALVAFDPLILKGDPGSGGAQGATGPVGATTNLTMGTVGTVPNGQAASASLTGVAPNQILNLILPAGPAGSGGSGGGGGGAHLVVASATASTKIKAGADYICTGTGDDVLINGALAALGGSGTVELSGGTFTTAATINLTAGQTLQGQGMNATLIVGSANTYHVIHMGNCQVDSIQRNYMSLRDLSVTSVGGSNSFDTLWVDGMGLGGSIRNVVAAQGRYSIRLTDVDQSVFDNMKAFNPRVAGIYCEQGVANTWGNVVFIQPSVALSDNNSICYLFDANADQGSANQFDRVTFVGGYAYTTVGLTGTTGVKVNVGATSMAWLGGQFENNVVHVDLYGQSVINMTSCTFLQDNGSGTTNIVRFNTNNHTATFTDCRFQQATNCFNGATGSSQVSLLGHNLNDGNITNLWTGSFGNKQGTDTVFAGDTLLASGLNNQRYGFVFGNNIVGNPLTLTPSSDSTAGVKFTKADGSTVVAAVDTTNSRLDLKTNKIINLANGSASTDAAAFGQIPSVIENVNTVATSSTAQTIPDVTTDTVSLITLTAACTLTFPTASAGKSFLLGLLQDATGSRTVTFPGTVKWPGGVTPILTTTASKLDLFSFTCLDGTNWVGLIAGQSI